MKTKQNLRILSVLLALSAVLILVWLWIKGLQNYSFIPLLMAVGSLFLNNLSKEKK